MDSRQRADEVRGMGTVGRFADSSSWGAGFDIGTENCFEGFGEYQIDGSGFRIMFFTPLPAELNRFAIDRTDLDANRGLLTFWRVAVPLTTERPKE
jgi:hypothetical protein